MLDNTTNNNQGEIYEESTDNQIIASIHEEQSASSNSKTFDNIDASIHNSKKKKEEQLVDGKIKIDPETLPCLHTQRREYLLASLGRLYRVGTLWSTLKICSFVHPNLNLFENFGGYVHQMQSNGKQNELEGDCKDRRDSHIRVEIILYESDRNRVSDSLGFDPKLNKQYNNIPNDYFDIFHYAEKKLAIYIRDIEDMVLII
jgi:hypothetical protein